MILHLLSEPKFDALIIKQIEECCPGYNLFLLFYPDRSSEIFEAGPKRMILFAEDFSPTDINNIEGIICHYLSAKKAEFLRSIPENIPLSWSIWGGDFYSFLPEYRKEIYSRSTKRYLGRINKKPWFFNTLLYKIVFQRSDIYRNWVKAVKRTRIFSTIIPYEKELVRRHLKSDAKYLALPTYSLEKVVDISNYENSICTKEKYRLNIIIGNSGNPSNNHLEILYFFEKFKTEDIKVQIPLTYGDNEYIRYICETGNSLLGTKFTPLLYHINHTDYLNYINCFNIFIFNNYRQQGIGTIIIALWSGGKVFLSNRNVTSSFYRDNGIRLFSIEDDLLTSCNHDIFNPLTQKEIMANREGLLKLYSNEKVNNSIKTFINSLKRSAAFN